MSDLLTTLVTLTGAELRRDGRYHADCPFCGKPVKKAQKHFSFVALGYFCRVCEAQGGLRALADHVGAVGYDAPAYTPHAPVEPPQPRQWQSNPGRVVDALCSHPARLPAWQAYKPLSIDTIARYRLGVGVLPSSRCRIPRLILPVYERGAVVALHGRAYLPGDDDAKWLTAAGSRKDVLFNADQLRPGCQVVICENMVDALLAQQASPGVVALAGGGVGWQDAWTQQIAAAQPKRVIVWLDNDLVGCPNPETQRRLLAAWRAEMAQRLAAGLIPRIPEPPTAHGPQIANDLLAAGVRASVYPWPRGTPPKADLGWALMQDMQEAA